jgi:hypothetical protein
MTGRIASLPSPPHGTHRLVVLWQVNHGFCVTRTFLCMSVSRFLLPTLCFPPTTVKMFLSDQNCRLLKGQCHQILCQLRPLVYRIGLNSAPRSRFTLLKSRVKCLRRFIQRVSKWNGGWILLCCSVRSNSMIRHNNNSPLAVSSQMHCGLPTPALRPNMNHGPGLWLSAFKFSFLTLAISYQLFYDFLIRGDYAWSAMTALKIGVWDLATEWNSVTAILYRESPCLKRSKLLTRDFKSIKRVRGALFMP